jgi:hypothetical protein
VAFCCGLYHTSRPRKVDKPLAIDTNQKMVVIITLTLSISSPGLSSERLQTLTGNLCRNITKETDIEAKMVAEVAQRGSKGEAITLGLIALTFLSGGSAVALLDVLKSYLARDSTLEMTLERNDGAKLVINAKNMRKEQIEVTFRRAKEFLQNHDD